MLRTFAGGTLFGVRYGDATPTVLALHGWRRSSTDFDRVFDETNNEATTDSRGENRTIGALALDLAGFGSTPAPQSPWGSAEYAASIESVLDEMTERIIVVGHSFGGRVALHLLARHRSRIGGLVLSGVPLLKVDETKAHVAWRYRTLHRLQKMRIVSSDRLEAARQRYGSTDYKNSSGVMREVLVRVLHEDYQQLMASADLPVELVWGAEDSVVAVEVAERATAIFPRARLTVVEGCTHLLPSTYPSALRDAIRRFAP